MLFRSKGGQHRRSKSTSFLESGRHRKGKPPPRVAGKNVGFWFSPGQGIHRVAIVAALCNIPELRLWSSAPWLVNVRAAVIARVVVSRMLFLELNVSGAASILSAVSRRRFLAIASNVITASVVAGGRRLFTNLTARAAVTGGLSPIPIRPVAVAARAVLASSSSRLLLFGRQVSSKAVSTTNAGKMLSLNQALSASALLVGAVSSDRGLVSVTVTALTAMVGEATRDILRSQLIQARQLSAGAFAKIGVLHAQAMDLAALIAADIPRPVSVGTSLVAIEAVCHSTVAIIVLLGKNIATSMIAVASVSQSSRLFSTVIEAATAASAAINETGWSIGKFIEGAVVNIVDTLLVEHGIILKALDVSMTVTGEAWKDATLFYNGALVKTVADVGAARKGISAALRTLPYNLAMFGSHSLPKAPAQILIDVVTHSAVDISKDVEMFFLTALVSTSGRVSAFTGTILATLNRVPFMWFRWGTKIPVVYPSTGPRYGGAGTNSAIEGDVAWTNPGFATASNDQYAAAVLGNQTSQWLVVTQFGFDLREGDQVTGIKAEVECKCLSSSSTLVARLVKAGVIQSSSSTINVTSTEAFLETGGENYLWEGTWTTDDINATGFGVAVRKDSVTTETFQVDSIRITIYRQVTRSPGFGGMIGLLRRLAGK